MAPGRALDRYRPACCAAVESFVQNRHRDEHKRKVTRARSLINNGWSVREDTRLQASRKNTRNERVQDDRYANIEKENIRLLLRMQEIDHRQGAGGAAAKAAARVVLGAPQAVGPTKCISRSTSLPAVGRGSNSDARMREMRRIDDENRKMLKRLQGTKPTYQKTRLEEDHQEQQRVMRMRQERGPKMLASRCPLPFDPVPPGPLVDPEMERLQDLHDELQRRADELEREEGLPDDGASPPATPLSGHSVGSADDLARLQAIPTNAADLERENAELEREVEVARQYIGGVMPEHSRLMVDKMMEEFEEYRNAPPAEEEAEDDRDAVSKMLAAAGALDAQELDSATGADALSYESVIQRSRASLQVSNNMLNEADIRARYDMLKC